MLFLTNINLNKNELQNAVIQNLSSNPSNPRTGQIYYNTTDKVLKQFNGTTWDIVGKEYTAGDGIDLTNGAFSADIGNGIELIGTSPSKKVAAKGYDGISVDSNGINADIDTTKGLTFSGSTSGSKKIALNVDGTLEFSSGALKVKVPTDNNFSDSLKNKLDDIESGAEVNVIETINVNGTALTPASKVVNIYTITSAAFADDTTATAASPVKMTLTDGNNQTVTANIPKVSSSSAGVAPKGAAVSTQSQSTKFLREDGTWAAPSYTSVSDYVKKDGTTAMTGALNMNSHKITSVTDPTNAQDAATKNYVDTAITNITDAMVFKGTVGKSGGAGTTATIPTSGVRVGDTYKIIEEDKSISASASTTGSAVTAKIGDTIVATATTPKWTVIPSGDEPSGTVTSVAVANATNGGLSVSGSPITSSGTITIGLDTAYGDTKNPYGSKTANYVLAAPNGSAGAPSFRALTCADVSDIATNYQAKGDYKTTQTAVDDPSVSNNATALQFISNISQDANGVITPTKKKVAADSSPTENSTNLITSGAVYEAIQTVTGGATSKKTFTNSALTASGGAWTWTISNGSSSGQTNLGADVIINVYEVSTGAVVMPEISVNQSTGAITITINDTNSATTLAAGTYKAVVIG